MTNDELRALADALEPLASLERSGSPGAVALESTIAYLRAQADAQPVAWMYEHDGCVDTPLFTVNRWTKCEEPWNESPLFLHPAPAAPQAEQPIDLDAVAMQQMRQAAAESTWMPAEYSGSDWISDVCRWLRDGPPAAAPQAEPSAALIRAYNSGYMQGHHDTVEAQFIVIHPLDMDTYHADVVAELGLTAAPQAEPCIGNDSACPCQDGDACHYKDATDGTKAWPVPQAEPKREPLSDEREARLTRERDALAKAMQTCVWALRQPLDDWKGECERKALDAANAALAQIEKANGRIFRGRVWDEATMLAERIRALGRQHEHQ